jgi:hypothetical protein
MMSANEVIGTAKVVPVRRSRIGDWPRWAPYAAVVWSLIYAALGIYWAVSGNGFPLTSADASGGMEPLAGRFGAGAGWTIVMLAGIPAAALGAAMLLRVRSTLLRGLRGRILRPILITAGGLLAGALLLLLTDLNLLTLLGYVPYTLFSLLTGGDASRYLQEMAQAHLAHQLLCLLGGFAWLGATIAYARKSGEACLYCGRRDGPEGWTSPSKAARWGRIAVYVAMVAPLFYALTRFAWALGFPLGMSRAAWSQGQEKGLWISGLFLASFGVVGAVLMLGLVQRWGEAFPRWIPGLPAPALQAQVARRRVPLGLALIPAALVTVVLVVGGAVIWSDLPSMAAALGSTGISGGELIWEIFIQVGPTLLFPFWGVALALAALGYYFRRRGACKVCGRGEG